MARTPTPQKSERPAKAPAGSTIGRAEQFEAKRLAILRGAAKAFAEQGFYRTSVSELAARLGVAKPVIYYYARDKDDLLFQCGQITYEDLRKAIVRGQREGLDGWHK